MDTSLFRFDLLWQTLKMGLSVDMDWLPMLFLNRDFSNLMKVFGSWDKTDGSVECYCTVFTFGWDLRLHYSNLQWQNWNPDNQYDVCLKGDHFIQPFRTLSYWIIVFEDTLQNFEDLSSFNVKTASLLLHAFSYDSLVQLNFFLVDFNLVLSSTQVCVVQSVQHGSVIAEYNVSGTTYAPEGIIFDSSGMQVVSLGNFLMGTIHCSLDVVLLPYDICFFTLFCLWSC